MKKIKPKIKRLATLQGHPNPFRHAGKRGAIKGLCYVPTVDHPSPLVKNLLKKLSKRPNLNNWDIEWIENAVKMEKAYRKEAIPFLREELAVVPAARAPASFPPSLLTPPSSHSSLSTQRLIERWNSLS